MGDFKRNLISPKDETCVACWSATLRQLYNSYSIENKQ